MGWAHSRSLNLDWLHLLYFGRDQLECVACVARMYGRYHYPVDTPHVSILTVTKRDNIRNTPRP